MYLALPREHRARRARRDCAWRSSPSEAWVQTSRSSPCARHVVRSCHAAGFEPNVAFESDDYQTVQGLVAAGVGVALIPELALSVVREDIVDPRALPRAAGAPGDRRDARAARASCRPRRRCSGSSSRPRGACEPRARGLLARRLSRPASARQRGAETRTGRPATACPERPEVPAWPDAPCAATVQLDCR